MNTFYFIGSVILVLIFLKPILMLIGWLLSTAFRILILPFGLIGIFLYVHYNDIRKMGNPITAFFRFLRSPFKD